MRNRNIAVVGAGPAGCAAAVAAALSPSPCNKRILIFEAGSVGKDKPCGDALTPDAVDALNAYGIDESDLRQLDGCPFKDVTVTRNGQCAQDYDSGPRKGWVVRRAALDRKLREKASMLCDLRPNAKVVKMEVAGQGFRLFVATEGWTEPVDVDAVVLATGAITVFPEQFGICGRARRAVAITQYSDICKLRPTLRFDFRQDLTPGYVWWFPAGARSANWGAFAITAVSAKALRYYRDRMVRLNAHPGYSAPRSGLLRLWSGRGGAWHSPAGIVSCGDAAGLVDPYSGEGISGALISGTQAGLAIVRFLAGSCTALEDYSEWVRSAFGARYDMNGELAMSWMHIAELSPSDFGDRSEVS